MTQKATQGAKWTGYFKFVTPQPTLTKMTDSQEMADAGAYNNYTWYQRLIQGSASRMTRYREYDLMDNHIDVYRALDTIAEEITGNNTKSDEPLDIFLTTVEEKRPESSTVLTLRAAIRRWFKVMEFESKLFSIVRMTVKFGDVFFKRGKTVWDKWLFIHPKNVLAAIVDQNDITKIVGWQIKKDVQRVQSGSYGLPLNAKQDTQYESEIVSAKEIVRFTLADDMNDTLPFGDSVLRPVYRTHKQMELLEDAILIYRIQRAPERRVFYIDVGKMPPQRVKTYLEGIKNEIKQKRVPTINGGQSEIDTVYNPHSMCLALDTEIPLLDGRTLTLQEMIKEHEEGKENWVYSIDPKTGNVVPGPVSWAGITRKDAKTIKLIFDNGDEITCTPDHKIPVQGKGFVEAKDLTENDSLFPFHEKREQLNSKTKTGKKTKGDYKSIYNPATKTWKPVYKMIASLMNKHKELKTYTHNENHLYERKNTIHHKDYNSLNDDPTNLVMMSHLDHAEMHGVINANQEIIFAEDLFERFEQLAGEDIHIKFKDLLEKISNDEKFMNIYLRDNGNPEDGKKYKIKTDRIRQKIFLKFMKLYGYDHWRDYQNKQIQKRIKEYDVGKLDGVYDASILQYVIRLIGEVSIHNFALVTYFKENKKEWDEFVNLYNKTFTNKLNYLKVPGTRMLETVSKYFGYKNFKHLVNESANFNHKVIRIEKDSVQDTGTLTIDKEEKYHNYHTFATKVLFIRNSEDFFFASRPDGRGSKVETLPGGQGLGELADLEYFQRKVWRGLRIPTSYMQEQDGGGAMINDGKVGMAYIQELRFALFISRLQISVEKTLDYEFKRFISSSSVKIDEETYEVRLPEPSNFGKYRQLELDTQLLGAYSSADGIMHLSKRFSMSRFLQMSHEDIIKNERMKAEELGLNPDDGDKNYAQIYASEAAGGEMGMGGGMGGGFMGGGMEGGMEGMGAEGEAGGAGAEGAAGGAPEAGGAGGAPGA